MSSQPSHVGYPLPPVILSTSTASINSPLCHRRSVPTSTPSIQDFQHQNSSSISSSITPVIAQIVRNELRALLQAQEATNSSSVPIPQISQQQQNPFQQPPTPSLFNSFVQQGEHPLTQQICANITSPRQEFPTPSNLFQHQPPPAQSDELPALPSRILDSIRRGEYVNFDTILFSSSTTLSGDVESYTLKIASGLEITFIYMPVTRTVHY